MLNKRAFLYQAGIVSLSNLALLLMSFVYRIFLGRLAGAEGMGVYSLVIQCYTILMSLCVYGMCVGVMHVSASLHARLDYAGLRKLVRYAICWFLCLYFLFAMPVLCFSGYIAEAVLGDPRTKNALCMILLCVLLTGVENIIKALLQGIRLVKYTSISEVGEQVLRIAFVVLLLSRFVNGDHGFTAFLILCAMTLSELYSVVYLCATYWRVIAQQAKKQSAKTQGIWQSFVRFALPSTCTSALGNVFASVTVIFFPVRLVVAGFTRSEAVRALGLLTGMVAPVLMLSGAFINALCTLLMPSIAGCVSRKQTSELNRKLHRSFEAAGLMILPPMAVLLPFAPLICTLLFGQTAPMPLATMVAVETVGMYYLLFLNSLLNGLGKQKQVLLFTALREVLQLTLAWILTALPSLHVYGYLAGMIIGDIFHVLCGLLYIRRLTRLRPRLFYSVIVPIASAVLLYAYVRGSFFVLLSLGASTVLALLASFAGCAAFYPMLLRLMGIRVFAYARRALLLQRTLAENTG